MEKFIGNVELLKKMGEKACNMAKTILQQREMQRNVEELYYEIVQKEEKNDKICIFDFKL